MLDFCGRSVTKAYKGDTFGRGDRIVAENSGFAEVNAYIYHTMRAAFYGGVIWCLGPVVDDSREYARYRIWLATVTCEICRRLLRLKD